MKYYFLNSILIFILVFNSIISSAQLVIPNKELPVLSNITGNFEINGEIYKADSTIDAPEVPEKFLNNAFLNLNYVNGNFKAGLRYEEYLGPLSGFDDRYRGSGITYRYAQYSIDGLDVTAGNFYDQFGNG